VLTRLSQYTHRLFKLTLLSLKTPHVRQRSAQSVSEYNECNNVAPVVKWNLVKIQNVGG